eukprot:gene5247-3758_t
MEWTKVINVNKLMEKLTLTLTKRCPNLSEVILFAGRQTIIRFRILIAYLRDLLVLLICILLPFEVDFHGMLCSFFPLFAKFTEYNEMLRFCRPYRTPMLSKATRLQLGNVKTDYGLAATAAGSKEKWGSNLAGPTPYPFVTVGCLIATISVAIAAIGTYQQYRDMTIMAEHITYEDVKDRCLTPIPGWARIRSMQMANPTVVAQPQQVMLEVVMLEVGVQYSFLVEIPVSSCSHWCLFQHYCSKVLEVLELVFSSEKLFEIDFALRAEEPFLFATSLDYKMYDGSDGAVFLHFRAGRMTYANGLVTPDTRRGDLTFSDVGNAVRMVWTSHATRTAFHLAKGKTKVSFVEKCTSGRVLLFEISDGETPTRHFFWLQDKSTAEDAEHLAALQSALKASEPVIKMADLKKIMERIPVKKEAPKPDINLENVIFSSKSVNAINGDTEFFSSRLAGHLPEDRTSTLMQQINNPQVKAAVIALERTLRDPSGFSEICRSYGLPETRKSGVLSFLQLIIEKQNSTNSNISEPSTLQQIKEEA